ncbi:hypothetical protein H2198_002493 [Neophaeococcomyces mojaviensis]|uniref:Uncharacterized protein n=1 Tax=Neophaeococcomyces mojaviensis TaxID=3383035 RepID=A0ACC3AE31_9EURO|nr:hypothetical protein H2198_002493 [Knufia sp. JES_112]
MSNNLLIYFHVEDVVCASASNIYLLSQFDTPKDGLGGADNEAVEELAPFTFLQLPVELQGLIFKFLFCSEVSSTRKSNTVSIWKKPSYSPVGRGAKAKSTHTRIEVKIPKQFIQLFVSREFLREALPIFSRELDIRVWFLHLSDMVDVFSHVPFFQSIVKGLIVGASYVHMHVDDHCPILSSIQCPIEQRLTTFSLLQNVKLLHFSSTVYAAWLEATKSQGREVVDNNSSIHQRQLVAVNEEDTFYFHCGNYFPHGLEEPIRNWLLKNTMFQKAQKLLAFSQETRRQCKIEFEVCLRCRAVPVTRYHELEAFMGGKTAFSLRIDVGSVDFIECDLEFL